MENLSEKQTRTNESVRLIFVGSPLVATSVKCDQDMLQHFGLKSNDCIRAEDVHDPLFRSVFENPESTRSAGGSALNSARIAKWLLKDKGEVSFTGCVGDDDFAMWIENQLISENVTPLLVKESSQKTGICACLLNSGDHRSMITRQGAAALFSEKHLNLPHIRKKLEEANCIFVVGYFVAHSPEVVIGLSEFLLPTQIFSLSLSAEYICRDYVKVLLKVLPRVNVLFGNEAEMKAFAKAVGGCEEADTMENIRIIRQLPRTDTTSPRIVIITRGSEPVLVDDGSNNLLAFKVPKDVPVVDSVGCGDAFAGAFLATYTNTYEIDAAVRKGIQAAVKILQVPGCVPPKTEFFIEDNQTDS